MSALPKSLGIFLAIAAATFLSGFAALAGACGGGLQEGGWNWQFLPPLFFGWVGGFLISLVCLAVTASSTLEYSHRLAIILLAPLLISSGVSAAAYSIMLLPERRAAAGYQKILSSLKAKPDAVRTLIAEARVRPLSSPERHALWQTLWVPRAIPAEDVSFLLEYFEQDGSALGGIMVHQLITPEQLRYLYEHHKNSRGYSRVLDELTTHPLTPLDVLQSLSESPNPFLAAKVHERLSNK
jgi:hypothetical protein